MTKWIDAMYDNMTAAVKYNSVLSVNLTLSNSTRQGCTLLPLIFILTLEPLLQHIRLNPDITGICVGKISNIVSAYVDVTFCY